MKVSRFNLWLSLLLAPTLFLASCDDDAPAVENEEEVIATTTLTFTPEGGGTPVVFTYSDPDGEGSQDPVITSQPLQANTRYRLDVDFRGPNSENITQEIDEEADEHMLYYGWTDGLFSTPAGNGNIDAREEGTVVYNDTDANGLPLGLTTTWETGSAATGDFTLLLKHQPGEKSATAPASTGTTDFRNTWAVTIE